MKEKRAGGARVDQLGSFCDLQPVHMRDLRKLDSSFSAGSQETSIVVRKQAILVNAGAKDTNDRTDDFSALLALALNLR